MSRAMNLNMSETQVTARCLKADVSISISAIEPLPTGGTHLVCTTAAGAEEMRHLLKKHVIAQKVERFDFFRVPETK